MYCRKLTNTTNDSTVTEIKPCIKMNIVCILFSTAVICTCLLWLANTVLAPKHIANYRSTRSYQIVSYCLEAVLAILCGCELYFLNCNDLILWRLFMCVLFLFAAFGSFRRLYFLWARVKEDNDYEEEKTN